MLPSLRQSAYDMLLNAVFSEKFNSAALLQLFYHDSLVYSPDSIVDKVVTQLEKAGWNFESLHTNNTQITIYYSPTIHPTGHHGPAPSLDLNRHEWTMLC